MPPGVFVDSRSLLAMTCAGFKYKNIVNMNI